ncbi:hypothetical protein DBV15_09158 [Temnothorax longispinosus]|uniref:Uncharacterized protein n=1 Tax=Temnothorax longispinosus TaxID=300112 RepID=A0A4S2KBS1_9HYME|nr:hypothetical protein DBV15_09158 [Temnothorax longispinosus]
MIGATKQVFADLAVDSFAQDFQVEGGHRPSGLGTRKRLLLDPGGFPNLAGPRTLLRDPLQKWLGRCTVSYTHLDVYKRQFADLAVDSFAQDFQVEGGHRPSGLGTRKRLLLDPGGFPNLAGPRTLLRDPLQKWLGRCMTRASPYHGSPRLSSRQMTLARTIRNEILS